MKNRLLINHRNQGRYFQVDETRGFVVEKGKGEVVVCLHGVPASSFLYRKVIDGLAANGFRGVAFDLLGMGLSDRPKDADYSWTALGQWCTRAIHMLGLEKFHLILHDIGGPIGCEVIARNPDRILSVTILNTPLTGLDAFKKPFPMFFFEQKIIGELFLSSTNAYFFKLLMHLRGIHRKGVFGMEEADAYVTLLKEVDGGESFLKIMRNFEATSEKETMYLSTLQSLDVPMQIIWGENDKGLSLQKYGKPLQDKLNLDHIIKVPGAHFLQEDYSDEVVRNAIDMITNTSERS